MVQGYWALPQETRDLFENTYPGSGAYQWAIQSQNLPAPPPGFSALPLDQQATWFGQYQEQAPSIWQQQSQQNAAQAAAQQAVASTPYQFPFLPNYQQWALRQPGYVPGSGTYNQWRLDRPGLFDPATGFNLQMGSGGPGDPNTGAEAQQTALAQGTTRYFGGGGIGNVPDELAPALNYFLRSDTPSGLSTSAPPPEAFGYLQQAIQRGYIVPSAAGIAYLQQQGQPAAGAFAAAQARGPVAGAGGAGAGGPGGAGTAQGASASVAASLAAEQAAQQVYREWLMRTGDERIAFEKATQAWTQTFSERQQGFTEEQTRWNRGITEAGLTGQYQGQQTQQAQEQAFLQDLANRQLQQQIAAQQQGTALNLLQLGSQLRGPANYAQYLQMMGQTPQGLRDLVGGLAGQYNFAGSSGPTGATTPASLQTLATDLLAPGGGQQAQDYQQATRGLPAPNQVNLANWTQANPTGRALALNAYEAKGWDPNDVQQMIAASAPRYTFGSGGSTGSQYRFG